MNRREFLTITSGAGLGVLAGGCLEIPQRDHSTVASDGKALKLLPYPKVVQASPESLRLGRPRYILGGETSSVTGIAMESLNRHLPAKGRSVSVRIGSVEEGYDKSWLTEQENEFLHSAKATAEASVLAVTPAGITVVGKGKWGMLYGVQTVCQLAIEAERLEQERIPCMRIQDWPDMKWRCLSPVLTWYSGWNRLEGYDECNWSEGEWKWLADWSLLHKCNTWAVVMCGYWPLTLPNYPQEMLDVDSFFYNPKTGKKEAWRFTHRNIKKEFYSKVIRYANERGIKVHVYYAKNSFNGCSYKKNSAIYAGGAAEMLPFAPGVDEYWDEFVGRILETGFNGFIMEDPEAYHVPNQNEKSYETFWEPWAATYGYSSVKETNQNKPPLGVHLEYYSWLSKTFAEKIRKHAQRLGREAEIYLISHILLTRIMAESKSLEERQHWFDLIDQKHGEKFPFIVAESDEKAYVDIFGGDRVASLGGRGGSCTCAMRRIASVNNNWLSGGMGGDLAYERDCQKRIFEAGGFGAMGYIFEWTNTEVFGYLAAQHLWNSAGIPGVSNSDQIGILDYSYRLYYGDEVGSLVAQSMDEGSDVNDAMVLEGVYGSQYPSTGKPLHRDYQLLAALADHGESLARQAYRLYTGQDPDLYTAVYDQDSFIWEGYERDKDHLFKAERLRKLWLSNRRSQEMCQTALAHRLAQRLMSEGASVGAVLEQWDRAVKFAKMNQLIYQINYDDDYDWTDGLCSKVTDRLETLRDQFLAECTASFKVLKAWSFNESEGVAGWTQVHDLTAPIIQDGYLQVRATGPNPLVVQTIPFSISEREGHCSVEIEMASDRTGIAQIYWMDTGTASGGARNFSEEQSRKFTVMEKDKVSFYRIPIQWKGELIGLRLDTPDNAAARIRSIRAVEAPHAANAPTNFDLKQPVPESVRKSAEAPVLYIPWEKIDDILPTNGAVKSPGVYLHTGIGFVSKEDFFRLGVVFTVETYDADRGWRPIFRRAVPRRVQGWEQWQIPLPAFSDTGTGNLRVRFVTDSYSRAQDRAAPTWKWALWGEPRLVRVSPDGTATVIYDFVKEINKSHPHVRLDKDGKERPFDGPAEDSTGATFKVLAPDAVGQALLELRGEHTDWQWLDGFVRWTGVAPYEGAYLSYLGIIQSRATHGEGEVNWLTTNAGKQQNTAVVFVGSSDFASAEAELWSGGTRLISFPTGLSENQHWRSGDIELFYIHGAVIPNNGISGIYVLRLPASMVTAGMPVNLSLRLSKKGAGWVMCHGYSDTLQTILNPTPSPGGLKSVIAAFTPHLGEEFGITVAEYQIEPGNA